MLTADGPALRPVTRAPDGALRPAIGVSAVLHAAVLAALLLSWTPSPHAIDAPPLEIEMIPVMAMTPGETRPRPTPPQQQTPSEGPAPTPTPPPPPPPNVNIGNGPEQSSPLTVTGNNIVPPEPDSRYRNLPPPYPADAARNGAEGTVHLLVRVAPWGVPREVRILASSGNQSLDSAALRAVRLWHFRPALEAGRAVPYDYELNIHFALGDHP